MPDVDSNSIPEMHHKYVAWNVYLVPSRVVLNRDKAHEPVRERLIRAATSTMLARAPNMNLINDKGRLSGYFNESWSESEVCKFNINPRDFFNDSDFTFVSSKNDLLTFAVRIEFTTQLLVFKTPAPSPTSDKERRNVIKLQADNKILKYQLGSLSRDYELLSLSVPNTQQVKTVSIKFTSDFAWRLMQLFSTGNIEENIQQRPYISPAEAGCATPTILPEKVQKSHLSELKSKIEELTDEMLQICEKGLNLPIQRFYLGGPIYLQTFCPAKPHGIIVIYSKSLPFDAQRKWQPAFLQVVAEEVKGFASESDQILQFLQGAFPGNDCLQLDFSSFIADIYFCYDWTEREGGLKELYQLSARSENQVHALWYIPAVIERRDIFVMEQDEIVRHAIRSAISWRNSIDWGGRTWEPNDYLLSLLAINAFHELTKLTVKPRITIATILEKMGRRVLQVELFSGPRTIIQWSRFYSSADYQLPLQTSPDQAPVIRDPTAPMVNVAASLLSWGPFRKEFARWGRQADLFHPDDYPEYSSGGSRSTTAAHGGGGGRRPNFGNTTLNSDQIQNTTLSDHSSFSDDMTSRLKNIDRFAGGQSYIFESEKNSLELATDNAPIIEAPDGTSTPRSGPSPNNAQMSHKAAQNGLKREKPLHSPQLDAISEHSERLNTGRNSLSKKSAGDLIEDPRKMHKKKAHSRQGADSSEDDDEDDRSYRSKTSSVSISV